MSRPRLHAGEGFYYLFNVDGPYVLKKIVRLAFPWTVSEWVRKADQGSGRYQVRRSAESPACY